MNPNATRVVVTGISMTSPLGTDLMSAYGGWLRHEAQFTAPEQPNLSHSSINYVGRCADPQLSLLPNRKVSKILRRKDLLGLVTAHAAVKDAQLPLDHYASERAAIFVGASSTQVGDSASYYPLVKACFDLPSGQFDSQMFGARMHELVNPLVVLQILMNNCLCYSSIDLAFRGANNNIMDFHTSGLRALEEGYFALRDGRCDVALVAGLAGQVEPFHLAEGWQAGLLAETRGLSLESAQRLVRPFSRSARGTIMSEGACTFVLERADLAEARGARIFAEVLGAATRHDGQQLTHIRAQTDANIPAPGLIAAMLGACREAEMEWSHVDTLVSHADGSVLTDRVTLASYATLLRQQGSLPTIAAYKNIFGDLCEASGLVAAALAIAGLNEGAMPGLPSYELHPMAKDLPIPQDKTIAAGRTSMISARHVFGSSSAVLLGKWAH